MQAQTGELSNRVSQPNGRRSDITSNTEHVREQKRSDAVLLYPHVIRMVRRMVTRLGYDSPAVGRMDASILLQKFLKANAAALNSDDVIESIARDLDLPDGTDEAEALINLCQFRTRQNELGDASWKSFVSVYPKIRASGFTDFSALNEVLEI